MMAKNEVIDSHDVSNRKFRSIRPPNYIVHELTFCFHSSLCCCCCRPSSSVNSIDECVSIYCSDDGVLRKQVGQTVNSSFDVSYFVRHCHRTRSKTVNTRTHLHPYTTTHGRRYDTHMVHITQISTDLRWNGETCMCISS